MDEDNNVRHTRSVVGTVSATHCWQILATRLIAKMTKTEMKENNGKDKAKESKATPSEHSQPQALNMGAMTLCGTTYIAASPSSHSASQVVGVVLHSTLRRYPFANCKHSLACVSMCMCMCLSC